MTAPQVMTRPLTSPATHADAPGHSGFAVRGTTFTTRAELAAARIHVPTQRPIALLRQSGQKRVAGGVQVTSLVAYGGVWSGVADGVSQLELRVVVAHVDRDSREEASAMMQAFVWGTLIRVVRATATATAPQTCPGEATQQFKYTYEGLFRVVSSGRSTASLAAAAPTPPDQDEDRHEFVFTLLGMRGQSLPCRSTSPAHRTPPPRDTSPEPGICKAFPDIPQTAAQCMSPDGVPAKSSNGTNGRRTKHAQHAQRPDAHRQRGSAPCGGGASVNPAPATPEATAPAAFTAQAAQHAARGSAEHPARASCTDDLSRGDAGCRKAAVASRAAPAAAEQSVSPADAGGGAAAGTAAVEGARKRRRPAEELEALPDAGDKCRICRGRDRAASMLCCAMCKQLRQQLHGDEALHCLRAAYENLGQDAAWAAVLAFAQQLLQWQHADDASGSISSGGSDEEGAADAEAPSGGCGIDASSAAGVGDGKVVSGGAAARPGGGGSEAAAEKPRVRFRWSAAEREERQGGGKMRCNICGRNEATKSTRYLYCGACHRLRGKLKCRGVSQHLRTAFAELGVDATVSQLCRHVAAAGHIDAGTLCVGCGHPNHPNMNALCRACKRRGGGSSGAHEEDGGKPAVADVAADAAVDAAADAGAARAGPHGSGRRRAHAQDRPGEDSPCAVKRARGAAHETGRSTPDQPCSKSVSVDAVVNMHGVHACGIGGDAAGKAAPGRGGAACGATDADMREQRRAAAADGAGQAPAGRDAAAAAAAAAEPVRVARAVHSVAAKVRRLKRAGPKRAEPPREPCGGAPAGASSARAPPPAADLAQHAQHGTPVKPLQDCDARAGGVAPGADLVPVPSPQEAARAAAPGADLVPVRSPQTCHDTAEPDAGSEPVRSLQARDGAAAPDADLAPVPSPQEAARAVAPDADPASLLSPQACDGTVPPAADPAPVRSPHTAAAAAPSDTPTPLVTQPSRVQITEADVVPQHPDAASQVRGGEVGPAPPQPPQHAQRAAVPSPAQQQPEATDTGGRGPPGDTEAVSAGRTGTGGNPGGQGQRPSVETAATADQPTADQARPTADQARPTADQARPTADQARAAVLATLRKVLKKEDAVG